MEHILLAWKTLNHRCFRTINASGWFGRHKSRDLQRCPFHSVENLSVSRVTWMEQFTTFHRNHFRKQVGTGHPGISVECRPEAEGQVKPEDSGR